MKAHGIAGNNGAARAGSAGPAEPSTPTNRKTATSRPSTNKKRKVADRGDDLDEQVKTEVKTEDTTAVETAVETEVKAEIKPEIKQEAAAFSNSYGSYMIHPSVPFEAAASESYKTEYPCSDGENLLVTESQTACDGSAASMAFVQQLLMPPPPDGFYGFIDPASDMRLLSPTSHPYTHEHDADYRTQTTSTPDSTTGHWLQHHQNTSFF